MPFTAQYHGSCAECEDPIIPGQRIEGDDGEYQHADCGERPAVVVCTCEKCFLVHAGECF